MTQNFLEACYNAALEVNTMIQSTNHAVGCALQSKGAGGDISITYDLLAEAIFVKHLSSFGQIHSEEGGVLGEGQNLIILDPIDGSDNLKSNFPYYGASVALQNDEKTIAAFVCNFANGDCFIKDATVGCKRSLTDVNCRSELCINTYAKVGLFEKAAKYPDLAHKLLKSGLKFRAPGAVALSLAYAYEVRFMIFVGESRPYDVAAGLYLCEDMYRYVSDELIVVSHNKDDFAKILSLFQLSNDATF